MHKPISASVTYPDHPKYEQQPHKLHDVIVCLCDGTLETVRLLATCPDAAIEIVRDMPLQRLRDIQHILPAQ